MSAPIRILCVHHEKALGGAPLSLLYLLRQMDRAEFDPSVLCLREGAAADLFRKEGLPVRVVSGPDLSHTELVWFRWWQFPRLLWRALASIPLFFRLRAALRQEVENGKLEVPHSPFPVPSSSSAVEHRAFSLQPSAFSLAPLVHLNSSTLVVAALAARSLGLPVVWHIREPLARGYLGLRRALLRWAIRTLATKVIAISRHDADQLGLVPAGRLQVVHNFVDFSQFDSARVPGAIRRELGIPPDVPLFLFLGGSTEVKGAGVLLRALPGMLGALRTAHVVIAGETDPHFREKTSAPPLDAYRGRIHCLGPRHDVPALLADATLLLFPSTVPHFARPVIEAAAMARPVVASDLGGVRELVRRNETAVLVPPGDPVALSRAVLELVDDPARAYRLGQQARQFAREHFEARQNAARTFEVFRQALAAPVLPGK